MAAPVFRSDWQELSRIRLRESRKLLKEREYSGAYHLAGLAVECALKACIAKATRRYEFPDKTRGINAFDHNLEKLVVVSGLKTSLDSEKNSHAAFDINWTTVVDWGVESRYSVISRVRAHGLYSAIAARSHGVMKWIRKHW